MIGTILLLILVFMRLTVPMISSVPQWVQNTPPSLNDTSSNPNFVSSLSSTLERKIDPITLSSNEDPAEFITRLEKLIPNHFGWKFVRSGENWIHFEAKTRFMGYVDDVVLLFLSDVTESRIEVKSASRIGYSDLGANRKRVEKLKQFLENVENE